MTDIEWGAEIAVDGKRPEWLRDGDKLRWYSCAQLERFWETSWKGHTTFGELNWGKCITHIRLPATHDYYKATSRGFTYWPGGENAPEDWDGGEVLFECGGPWVPHPDSFKEQRLIIGYRKRTEQPAPAIAPELVERMVRLVKLCRDVICAGPYANEARAILAELEPDPDLTLAKSIVGDAEAIALAIKAARENGRG